MLAKAQSVWVRNERGKMLVDIGGRKGAGLKKNALMLFKAPAP